MFFTCLVQFLLKCRLFFSPMISNLDFEPFNLLNLYVCFPSSFSFVVSWTFCPFSIEYRSPWHSEVFLHGLCISHSTFYCPGPSLYPLLMCNERDTDLNIKYGVLRKIKLYSIKSYKIYRFRAESKKPETRLLLQEM